MKKLPIEALEAGMYVTGFTRDDAAAPDMFMNSIRISSKPEVESFKAKGYRYAFIVVKGDLGGVEPKPAKIEASVSDERYGLPEAVSVTVDEIACAGSDAPDVTDTATFDEEIGRAKEVKAEASSVVARFMHEARAGKGVDNTRTKEVVGSMVDSVMRNQDALLSLSRLKDYDNYTFGHSVNVSIIAIALGRHLGYPADKLGSLGFGAILHDIGKMKVPDKILNKPAILTDEEFCEMKNHVSYGAAILGNTEHISSDAIGIAFQHHERYDGKGYPRGLLGRDLHPYSRIVCIADVYDAMTTVRPYSSPMGPSDALKRIYGAKGTHFDPVMVDRFIKCLGIYPIGSHVKLDNGEIAEVKSVNRKDLLRPAVTLLYDADLSPYEKPIDRDLASEHGGTISGPVDLKAFGLSGKDAGAN